MKREEWKEFQKSCQVAMADWFKKEIKSCKDCGFYAECNELGWQNVENHRQPDGRFGKIYAEELSVN